MRAAPAEASPLDAVAAALRGVLVFFPPQRRESSRSRGAVIADKAGLQERELLKVAVAARQMASASCERSVTEPAATIAANNAIAVFSAAFTAWLTDGETRQMPELIDDGLRQLSGLVAER